MVEYETNIDTVAIQLDFNSHQEQRDMLNALWQWIIDNKIAKLTEFKTGRLNKFHKYSMFYGHSKIATIHTGYTSRKSSNALYYLRIRFAGLKSFNTKADRASYDALMHICAYLNTNKVSFRFVELDIAIDTFCKFNNILAGCIKPTRNVRYNPLGYTQYFNKVPTMYLEELSDVGRRKNAYMRSYLYNKGAKENLEYEVTRWELKLQNRYFLDNGFNMYAIEKALNKYRIAYFNKALHPSIISHYDSFAKLGQEYSYTNIYPDVDAIKEFIATILDITLTYKN